MAKNKLVKSYVVQSNRRDAVIEILQKADDFILVALFDQIEEGSNTEIVSNIDSLGVAVVLNKVVGIIEANKNLN